MFLEFLQVDCLVCSYFSIEFDRDDELFATAGVSRCIKVFDFSSVMSLFRCLYLLFLFCDISLYHFLYRVNMSNP